MNPYETPNSVKASVLRSRQQLFADSPLKAWLNLTLYSGMTGAAFAVSTFVAYMVLSTCVFRVGVKEFEMIALNLIGAMGIAGILLGVRYYFSRMLYVLTVMLMAGSLICCLSFWIALPFEELWMFRGEGKFLFSALINFSAFLCGIAFATSFVVSAVIISLRTYLGARIG